MYNKKHPYGAVSLHPSRKYDQSFYWRILPWNQFSFAAAACVSACVHMVCVCGAESGSAGSARLAGVEVSAFCSGFLSLASAGQAGAAVAALEDLQTVSSFPPVTCAHLPLRQHGLTDPWPEVSGAAEPFHTVQRPETRLALATWQIINHISVHSSRFVWYQAC